jgi:putative MATE family efflux protein
MIKRIIHHFRKERDLTTGSISKAIWILAIPMIVSNMLQSAFNLVDMAFVGRLGPVALAAVAMAGQILMIVMFLMIGVGAGTTALVSRAIGEKNRAKADNIAMQTAIIGLIGSVVFGTIGYFASPWLLKFLGASPEVIEVGTGYLQITFAGIMALVYMFSIAAVLQGAGDAATPMIILGLSTILNIALDPLLIFGIGIFPRLGVNGAAWATVISRGIGAIIALEVLLRGRSRVHVRLKYLKFDFDIIWRILKIGIPASAQMTLRGLVGVVVIAVVAGFGTAAVAAYGVGIRFHMLAMMPGFALGMAAQTLVGQNLGAKQPDRASRSAWTTTGYYSIFMLTMSALFIIFAPSLILIFNNDPQVLEMGTNFLRITAWGYLFIAFSLIFNRSLSGAGDTISPLILTFVALWLVQLPLAIYLSRIPGLGVNGIWIAVVASYVVQGITTVAWFQTGKWKHKKV